MFDPQDSDTLYAGWFGRGMPSDISGPGGIYKSTDGGETWASLPLGNPVAAFAIDPQNTSTIYLPLQRSVDGGATFTPLPADGFPQSGASIVSLAIHPADPSMVFAAAVGYGPSPLGVYRATFVSCSNDHTALCLGGGRFRVEVDWQRKAAEPVQHARGAAVSTESGYFWFQDGNSVELMIKVLDGRLVNGFFWVFYGALTDRGYTIRVTDLLTGEVRTYVNERGHVASVADTKAFAGEGGGVPQEIETAAVTLAGRPTGAAPDVLRRRSGHSVPERRPLSRPGLLAVLRGRSHRRPGGGRGDPPDRRLGCLLPSPTPTESRLRSRSWMGPPSTDTRGSSSGGSPRGATRSRSRTRRPASRATMRSRVALFTSIADTAAF